MQRRKHWTFLCVVLVVVAMFPTSSEAQEGDYTARQCSGPNDIQDVAQVMREQADNGESIFDSLSPSCKDAFVAGNAVASVEITEPRILDSESQTVTAPDGSTFATTCQTAYVGANHYTLLGFLAFTFNLYEHYCTLADGWRIDGTPYAYWNLSNVDPNFQNQGTDSSAYYWVYYPTQFYTTYTAQVTNCVFKYGCFGTYYPWGDITVYGNTTYYDANAGGG